MGNVVVKGRQLPGLATADSAAAIERIRSDPDLLRAKSARVKGTVIHHAAYAGDAQLLEGIVELVKSQAETSEAAQQQLHMLLNQTYGLRVTPLMAACSSGHADVARLLLDNGADPWRIDRRGGNTCLHQAASGGHADVIKVVLQASAASNATVTSGSPVSPSAAAQSGQPGHHAAGAAQATSRQLLSGAEQQQSQQQASDTPFIEFQNIWGVTPIFYAICNRHLPAAEALLEGGASITARSYFSCVIGGRELPSGSTPLHAAVWASDWDLAVLLLRVTCQRHSGTQVSRTSDPRRMQDADGRMPYHIATRLHLPAQFAELLHPGAPLIQQLQLLAPDAAVMQISSLQDIAARQLQAALKLQLLCYAAAAGISADQLPQRHSKVAPVTEQSLQGAAAELLCTLKAQHDVCVRVGACEHICMQLQSPASTVDAQSVLDVVRLFILCHRVCDPVQQGACGLVGACDACSIATTSAAAAAAAAAAVPGEQQRGNSPCSACGEASSAGTAAAASSDQAAAATSSAVAISSKQSLYDDHKAQQTVQAQESAAAGGGCSESTGCSNQPDDSGGCNSSRETAAEMPQQQLSPILPGLQALQVNIQPSSRCKSIRDALLMDDSTDPQHPSVLDSSRLVQLLQNSNSRCVAQWQDHLRHHASSSSSSATTSSTKPGTESESAAMCNVCFREQPLLLMALQPCRHVLCISCSMLLVELAAGRPSVCPFCRAAIAGFAVQHQAPAEQ